MSRTSAESPGTVCACVLTFESSGGEAELWVERRVLEFCGGDRHDCVRCRIVSRGSCFQSGRGRTFGV